MTRRCGRVTSAICSRDHGELRKITEIHKTRGLKGDEIVTEQVREGMRGKGSGGGGTIEVLSWFLNSFLGSKIR